MSEKTILDNALTLNKSLIMLCINGAIESSNKKVLDLFKKSLTYLLTMQEDTFNLMSEKSFYNIKNIKESDIAKLCTKLKSDTN